VALLIVSVDDVQLAAVATDGLEVLTVNLSGSKVDEEFSHLEFSGGRYPRDETSTHLIWLSELVIRPGQRVRVQVAANGATSHAGKSIEELFPDERGEEEECDTFDFSEEARAEVIANLEKRPQIRNAYSFEVKNSSGQTLHGRLSADEHGFGANFIWNSTRPERVSASLHTYTLAQLRDGTEFTYHYREHLLAGTCAEVTLEI
jgi:hypothetical protein